MQSQSTPVQIPLLARDGSVVGFTLVDAADAEWVNRWVWRLLPGRTAHTNYAHRSEVISGVYTNILLHRELLELPRRQREPQVDHIAGGGLINTRSNLRIATNAENSQNQRLTIDNASGYRGVNWSSQHRKWRVQIRLNGQLHHLGLFADPKEAGAVAAAWRREHMPFATD